MEGVGEEWEGQEGEMGWEEQEGWEKVGGGERGKGGRRGRKEEGQAWSGCFIHRSTDS